jgi:mRNA interferase MazF
MSNHKPLRGEIWFVDLNPVVGHEQAKTRPCLIVSNNIFNQSDAYLHTVLPIISKNKKNPLHVPVTLLNEGSLEVDSFILCDQIRTISRQRLRSKSVSSVTQETLEAVEYVLSALLDI